VDRFHNFLGVIIQNLYSLEYSRKSDLKGNAL